MSETQFESPFANLLAELIDRLNDKAKSLRYITQDVGQLENYDIRPAVSWPCGLLDIDNFNFTDAQSKFFQIGLGTFTIRIGHVKYTDISNLTPSQTREAALKYFETEQEVYKALHGWSPAGFSRCLRVAAKTERRDDDIRVRAMVFGLGFTDESAAPVRTSMLRPDIGMGID